MEKHQFSGKTVDDALAEAARSLSTEKSALSYNIISSSGGLFSKLFSKGVKLEVWVDDHVDIQAQAREAVLAAIKGTNPQKKAAELRNAMQKDAQKSPPEMAGPDGRPAHQNGRAQADSRGRDDRKTTGRDGQQPHQRHSSPGVASPKERGQGQGRQTKSAGGGAPQPGGRDAGAQRGPNPQRNRDANRSGPREQTAGGRAPSAGANPQPAAGASGRRGGPNGREQRPGAAQGAQPRQREQREPRAGDGAGSASLEPRAPLIPIMDERAQEILNDYTERFLRCFELSPEDVKVITEVPGEVQVQVQDAFLEDLLSRSDRLSTAFEHVYKRLAQKKIGDVSGRLTLDSLSALEKRNEKLQAMAMELAEKVKASGRSVTLGSRSSQERRVIHLSIDGLEGVATRSVGSGEKRKLVIYSTAPGASGQGNEGEGGAVGESRPGNRRDGGRKRRRGGGGGGARREGALTGQAGASPVPVEGGGNETNGLAAGPGDESPGRSRRRRGRGGGGARSGGPRLGTTPENQVATGEPTRAPDAGGAPKSEETL